MKKPEHPAHLRRSGRAWPRPGHQVRVVHHGPHGHADAEPPEEGPQANGHGNGHDDGEQLLVEMTPTPKMRRLSV